MLNGNVFIITSCFIFNDLYVSLKWPGSPLLTKFSKTNIDIMPWISNYIQFPRLLIPTEYYGCHHWLEPNSAPSYSSSHHSYDLANQIDSSRASGDSASVLFVACYFYSSRCKVDTEVSNTVIGIHIIPIITLHVLKWCNRCCCYITHGCHKKIISYRPNAQAKCLLDVIGVHWY